ncbi:MAG: decaprenyl-phosphate phosphoribosyltransferase, partial [Candidatus Margulisiibacteriota bacterium]
WLLICTTLLALFIGFSKRRHEIVILEGVASGQREVLKDYSADYLDQMIAVVSCATVLSYLFYTQAAETVGKFGTHRLIFTTPFIFYGIFRYLYLVHKKELGGSPEEMLLTDWPLLVDVVLWGLAVLAIIHWR